MEKLIVPITLIVVVGTLYALGAFRPRWTHKHRCARCTCIWEHDPKRELRTDAHNCPKCGTKRKLVYYGTDAAMLIGWGENKSPTEDRLP